MKKGTVDVAILVVEILCALALMFITGYTVGRSVHDFVLGGGDFAYQFGEPRIGMFVACCSTSSIGAVMCAWFASSMVKQMYPRRDQGGRR